MPPISSHYLKSREIWLFAKFEADSNCFHTRRVCGFGGCVHFVSISFLGTLEKFRTLGVCAAERVPNAMGFMSPSMSC
jgi:hypothetical protein